jgi:Hydantoinase/oxoprolinase N-terminal region/Hydantoinase/oxoprolinase
VRRRIGIDVGGTNTDAVLLEEDAVAAAVKTPTTPDVTTGITRALAALLAQAPAARGAHAAMIGTTHFTNAVVERRDLGRVAAVRIGLPSGASLPPFVDWPEDLAALVRGEVVMLEGGHEFDGRPLVPFDGKGMREASRRIRTAGIRSVAISAVFSPLNPSGEEEAAAIIREECPDVAVTLSHRLGRIGLLERENAALLNACLIELARKTTRAFTDALRASGIRAPLYLTQNDGTVMRAEVAETYPVYSFASGPTNSMRGAAFPGARRRWWWTLAAPRRTSGACGTAFRARRTASWRSAVSGRSSGCPICCRWAWAAAVRSRRGRARSPSGRPAWAIASPRRLSCSAATSSPRPTSRWPPGSSISATARGSPRCRPRWWTGRSPASAP